MLDRRTDRAKLTGTPASCCDHQPPALQLCVWPHITRKLDQSTYSLQLFAAAIGTAALASLLQENQKDEQATHCHESRANSPRPERWLLACKPQLTARALKQQLASMRSSITSCNAIMHHMSKQQNRRTNNLNWTRVIQTGTEGGVLAASPSPQHQATNHLPTNKQQTADITTTNTPSRQIRAVQSYSALAVQADSRGSACGRRPPVPMQFLPLKHPRT